MALTKKADELLNHFVELYQNTGNVSFNSEYYPMHSETALGELAIAGYILYEDGFLGTVTLTDRALKLAR